jgi:hypothetical protein
MKAPDVRKFGPMPHYPERWLLSGPIPVAEVQRVIRKLYGPPRGPDHPGISVLIWSVGPWLDKLGIEVPEKRAIWRDKPTSRFDGVDLNNLPRVDDVAPDGRRWSAHEYDTDEAAWDEYHKPDPNRQEIRQ